MQNTKKLNKGEKPKGSKKTKPQNQKTNLYLTPNEKQQMGRSHERKRTQLCSASYQIYHLKSQEPHASYIST